MHWEGGVRKGRSRGVDTSIVSGPISRRVHFPPTELRLSRTNIELLLGRSSRKSGDGRLKCACATHIWREINEPVLRTIGLEWVSWHISKSSRRSILLAMWVLFLRFPVNQGAKTLGRWVLLNQRDPDFPCPDFLWHDPSNPSNR